MAEPTQTNISQTTIPDYAKPYVETLLGKAEAITDISKNPYVAYPGQRTADFVKLQNDAFAAAGKLGPASQLTDATSLAQKAGLGALGTQFQAGQYANQYGYTPDSFLGQGTAAAYMNPYMQNVVDIQQREARRQAGIGATQQQAQAVQAGAFGGSRDAIMRAERERNLATQLGDIQATGSNAAYNQAMQQFNAEQAARMQSAGLGAQYGQAANQLGEQSRQFGAGLGLQGLQTALQGAGALGNLGATQFGQQAQTLGIQGQMGGTQQQQQQNILNQQYQALNTGYQNALTNALAKQQLAGTTGTSAGTLASSGQQNLATVGKTQADLASTNQALNLADINALATLGGQQQTIAQNKELFPLTNLSTLSGLLRGYNVPTSTTTTATGSPLSALAGLASLGNAVTGGALGTAIGTGLTNWWNSGNPNTNYTNVNQGGQSTEYTGGATGGTADTTATGAENYNANI